MAKVASDAEKPDGFVVLTREQACERFAGRLPLPHSRESARRRQSGSRARGINHLAALASTPEASLVEWFGARLGPYLGGLARFEDERRVTTVRVAKSESRETTFDRDLLGLDALEPVLERLAAQLCAALVKHDRRGRTIGIKLRFADFSTHTRARTLEQPVNELASVLEVARGLLRELDPREPGAPARRASGGPGRAGAAGTESRRPSLADSSLLTLDAG